jgi:hypothetical protein
MELRMSSEFENPRSASRMFLESFGRCFARRVPVETCGD